MPSSDCKRIEWEDSPTQPFRLSQPALASGSLPDTGRPPTTDDTTRTRANDNSPRAPPRTSAYLSPLSYLPSSGLPLTITMQSLSAVIWYPCALAAGRACAFMRDPPAKADVLALAPTCIQELKTEPLDMIVTFSGYLDISPASDGASVAWATSRPLLLRDMLHLVVWQLARGKTLRVAEQIVLQGLCTAIIRCTALGTMVSRAQVSRLQSGVVGHGVNAEPSANIRTAIQLVDAALIASNEFIQSQEWDTFMWTKGSAARMLSRLIELSFAHEQNFTALRKKFVQVVTIARGNGLVQHLGNTLHDEFVSRINTFDSPQALLDCLKNHTVGSEELQWEREYSDDYEDDREEPDSYSDDDALGYAYFEEDEYHDDDRM